MGNINSHLISTSKFRTIVFFLLHVRIQIHEHGIIMSISPNTLISKNQKNLIVRKS